MLQPVGQRQGIPIIIYDGKSAPDTALFEGHANGSVIRGIGIAITRVKKVEPFFGKIEPSVGVEIFCIVFPYQYLEIPRPGGYYFMVRFSGRSEIIRFIIPLFMKIDMYLGESFIIKFQALLCLCL